MSLEVAEQIRLANERVEQGEPALALELIEKLLPLALAVPDAHAVRGRALLRLGRGEDSLVAWRQAITLAPELGKLHWGYGLALQHQGHLAEGLAACERAIALEPGRDEMRRSLAVHAIKRGDLNAARQQLASIVGRSNAVPLERGRARIALICLDVREDLAGPLAQALREFNPDTLRPALAALPDELLQRDDSLLERLRQMASMPVLVSPPQFSSARAQAAKHFYWPAIEAHFDAHQGDGIRQVQFSIDLLKPWHGQRVRLRQRSLAALKAGADAVVERDGLPWPPADGLALECWFRYFHCRLNAIQPSIQPGYFKALPNLVIENSAEERTRPEAVVATLREVFSVIPRDAARAPLAAALWLYLLAKMHPFDDGNGGIGRFVASGVLQRAGYGPLIVPDALRGKINAAIREVHGTNRIEALIDVILACLAWRDELLDTLVAHSREKDK